MPTVTDDAVALRTWEYSETSQTVALFAREHGMLRALAKGARRDKAGFSGGIEVLTRGRAVAIVKTTTDLATLTAWDLLTVYWRFRHDLHAHRAGLYLVDLVYHAITDADPHPGLYDTLVASLDSIEAGDEPLSTVARFQWALLREIGSRPDLDVQGGETLFFEPVGSRFHPAPSAGAWPVRRETLLCIRGFDHPSADGSSPENERKAARFLSEYLAYVIGKDLPTRRAIFGDLVMH